MKDHIELTKHYGDLLDFYGRLLTVSQRDIMSDYYLYDLSLAEISQNRQISRSAVSDTIRKAATKLENFEEKLGLAKIFAQYKAKLTDKSKIIIEEIEGKIKNGI